MMKVEILNNSFDKKKFNEVAPHPLQSWEWGEARKSMGIEVLRIGEFQHDALQHVYQITFHPIPKTPFTIGYLPRSVMPSDLALELIKKESDKRRAIFVKCEPNEEVASDITEGLTQSSHPLFPQWTQVLDLSPSESELLANMKPKTRYNIKLAEKKGVVIKEMTNEEGFKIFADLYFETTGRQEYHGHSRDYHKTLFEHLKSSMSHIFIAFYNGEPLAAYHIFLFNNILYYPYGGSSELHRNLMAPHLLMWEVIKFGKKHGATFFDMWGSLPKGYDHSTPWAGFTRFKEGFGTEFYEFAGSYDLINNKILYYIYNISYRIRKKLL